MTVADAQPEVPAAPVTPAAVPRRSALAEWTITLVLLLYVTTVLVQSFVIPTPSMEDTLLRGDHVLVDKLAYAPHGPFSRYVLPYTPLRRGDIVVFRYPVDLRKNYVKRIAGVPRDRIRVTGKQLYVNGKAMVEPYVQHKTAYFDSYRDYFPGEPNVPMAEAGLNMLRNAVNGEVVVPDGCFFVMGDNRDNSEDSRYWGFVPRANIIGKPLLVFWSYDAPSEHLADPNIVSRDHVLDLFRNFFTKTRWSRTFHLIRGHELK